MAKKPNHKRLVGKTKAGKAHRFLLERFYMLVATAPATFCQEDVADD